MSMLGPARTLASSSNSVVPVPPGRLRIELLGGLTLSVDGTPLKVANRKGRAMLAWLALQDSAQASRERLAGLLWSDVVEHHARNSLRQAVFELRGALQGTGCRALRAARGAVGLDMTLVELDLEEVLASLAQRRLPKGVDLAGKVEQLLATHEDLSPLFAEWLAATRRSVHLRLMRLLEDGFADLMLPPRQRRELAAAALLLDPLHEEACRTVMRLAAEEGEIGVALRAYAGLYERLGTELDMEPSASTQALVAAIKCGEVRPAAAAPAARPTPPPMLPVRRRQRHGPLAPEGTPVIAVVPFRAIGPEPLPAYLADGIIEDIVHLLAGMREPVVISANSTRLLRPEETGNLAVIGERLGADYLVTGSLRLSGDTARIGVELAEATQGTVLWGRSFEVAKPALFATQAEIAAGIAHAVVPRMNEAELRATRRRPPEDLGAYHLLLRARDRMFTFHPEPFAEAGRLLKRAAALDPDFAPIYAAMIEWHCYNIFEGLSQDREADAQALEAAARRALHLDPCQARALAIYGHNRTIIGRAYDEAIDLLDRAVAAGPNDAEALIWTSPTLAYVGRAEEAIQRASRAIALSPQDPCLGRYEHFLSIAHYAAGDLEEAARIGLRSASRNPNFASNLRITVAALGGLGRVQEAAPLVEQLMAIQPGLRVAASLPRYAFRDARMRERHAQNLRLAGVPG